MTPQQANISQRLRDLTQELRRTPKPLAEIIPLLNAAADELDRRAPAPTEPAVDRDAACMHRNKTAGWDHLTCDDCGAFHAAGKEWGIADRKWFPSEAVARFYQKNGSLPALATPAVPAAPTTILPTNESEK